MSPNCDESFARVLIPVWLVTAAWDFMCASALTVFVYRASFASLWQGVASVALGPQALTGGPKYIVAGIALHTFVAFVWSGIFILLVKHWPLVRDAIRTPEGAFGVAAVYGPVIWLVMSLLVIPIAARRAPHFGVRWWVQVFAHIPFVTIPLVFTARRVMRLSSANEPSQSRELHHIA